MYLRGVLLAQPFWRIVESMSSETIIWFRMINFHRVQEHVPYYNVVILQSMFKYYLGSSSYPARQMKSIAFYSHHVQWNNCHRYSTWGRQGGDTVKKEIDTIEKRLIISISILQWKGIVCCHHLKFGRYNFLFTSALPNTKGMVRICKIRFISGSVFSAIRSLCQQLEF